MNVKNLTSGLRYRGDAEGKRQTYYVFEGRGYYFVLSFKKDGSNAGNFNVIDTEAAEYVQKKFADRSGITSKEVYAASHKARYFANELEALNVLYILVAIGRAKVDKRYKSLALYFNIKSHSCTRRGPYGLDPLSPLRLGVGKDRARNREL